MRLDHVIVAVQDLEAAAATFKQLLGRPPALVSRHSRGTANALFLFPNGPYLELLARWDAPERGTSAAALEQRLAERGEGLHGLAFASDNLDADVAWWRGQGFTVMDPVANQGVSSDGLVRRWRAVRFPDPDGNLAYLVQHEDESWKRERLPAALRGSGDGVVQCIHHVAMDVDDPVAVSEVWSTRHRLALVQQLVSERMGAIVNVHEAGGGSLEVVGATRGEGPVTRRIREYGTGLSSLAFTVGDITAAIGNARAAGATVGDVEESVLPNAAIARIARESACGVAAQYFMAL